MIQNNVASDIITQDFTDHWKQTDNWPRPLTIYYIYYMYYIYYLGSLYIQTLTVFPPTSCDLFYILLQQGPWSTSTVKNSMFLGAHLQILSFRREHGHTASQEWTPEWRLSLLIILCTHPTRQVLFPYTQNKRCCTYTHTLTGQKV